MFRQFGKMMQLTLVVAVALQSITTSESFSIRSISRPILQHPQQVCLSAPVAAPCYKTSLSPLFSSKNKDLEKNELPTYGGLLGVITGLSMTAIRKSIRTTTGLSLTATRTTLRGLTGLSVTAAMKNLFGVFPPWFRYFIQPFFIMYYTPLMILKYYIGSTKGSKQEALAAHETVIEGWKDAIRAAEVAQESLPLHVTDDGTIESLTPQSVAVTDAIVESLNIASTVQDKSTN